VIEEYKGFNVFTADALPIYLWRVLEKERGGPMDYLQITEGGLLGKMLANTVLYKLKSGWCHAPPTGESMADMLNSFEAIYKDLPGRGDVKATFMRTAETQRLLDMPLVVAMGVGPGMWRSLLSPENVTLIEDYTLGMRPRSEVFSEQQYREIRAKLGIFAMAPGFVRGATIQLVNDSFNELLKASCTKVRGALEPVIAATARFHNAFVCMHPMADGNGRFARTIANWMLLGSGLEPVLARTEEYTNAVRMDMRNHVTRDNDPRPPTVCITHLSAHIAAALAERRASVLCWSCGADGAHVCSVCRLARFCQECEKDDKQCSALHKRWCNGAIGHLPAHTVA
jgi:fido (protein-threonine AMPylation protein)